MHRETFSKIGTSFKTPVSTARIHLRCWNSFERLELSFSHYPLHRRSAYLKMWSDFPTRVMRSRFLFLGKAIKQFFLRWKVVESKQGRSIKTLFGWTSEPACLLWFNVLFYATTLLHSYCSMHFNQLIIWRRKRKVFVLSFVPCTKFEKWFWLNWRQIQFFCGFCKWTHPTHLCLKLTTVIVYLQKFTCLCQSSVVTLL